MSGGPPRPQGTRGAGGSVTSMAEEPARPDAEADDQDGFSTVHRAVVSVTGGRLGTKFRGQPLILLTTTGRKTGRSAPGRSSGSR